MPVIGLSFVSLHFRVTRGVLLTVFWLLDLTGNAVRHQAIALLALAVVRSYSVFAELVALGWLSLAFINIYEK